MKKTIMTSALVLGIFAAGSVTFAFPGGERGDNMGKKMGEMHQRVGMMHHEDMQAAFEANDYSLLSEDAQARISEEDFADKVEHYEAMQAHKEAVEQAIINNDFEAFVTLHEEHKAQMDAWHEEQDDDMDDKKMKRPEWTEEEEQAHLQEIFDRMVAYYEENGELPDMMGKGDMKMGKKGDKEGRAFGMQRSGERKYFNEGHRGLVQHAIRNVSDERLTQAVERIDEKLEMVTENEDLEDETKQRVLDLLNGIKEVIQSILGS